MNIFEKKNHIKNIIIGAGASGLMCASHISHNGDTLILEAQVNIASKVKISGGGNCNFTNLGVSSNNYLSSNPHFTKSALARFNPCDIIEMLQKAKIKYEERQNQQLFAFGARNVVNMLLQNCLSKNVKIQTSCTVFHVTKENDIFYIFTENKIYSCDNLIIATGGLSYPKLGATDLGYKIAKQFNHKIINTRPALVGLIAENNLREFCAKLAGISLPVTVTIGEKTFSRDLLFTHLGISGPAILNASLYNQNNNKIVIDFLNGEDLDHLINGSKKTTISNILSKKFPTRFVKLILGNMDCYIENLSKKNKQILNNKLTKFIFNSQKTMGYDRAEVTAGGVDVKEISSQNMESKLCPHLFFIGEVLDVTGELGGFNLHWAWASANAVNIL